jgi:hypothetical protein
LFVSEQIEVKTDSESRMPVEFIWRGQIKSVKSIVTGWQDWKFPGGVHKPTWRQRRHRNYYRVLCDDRRFYEIYLDRGIENEPKWFLYRIIDNETFA